jgi:hypothetical protein
MLAGAAIGMADGPTAPAGPTLASSSAETPPADFPPTKPWRITDLGDIQPAEPMSPEEVDPYRVGRYALDNGAIAMTFDPETDVLSVLFPLGSDPPPPPETTLNVSVRTASFPSPVYDAAAMDLTSFEWSPGVKGTYSYGISLDAATGLITVDTDAPAEVTAVLDARHPGIFRFRSSTGFSRLGPAPGG